MAYSAIDAKYLSQLISDAGASAQEQAWAAQVALGSLGRSMFGKVLNGGGSGVAPIRTIADFQKIHGTTVNFQARAPLGGAGRQGSAEERIGHGENRKFKMWSFQIGVHWHGVKANNIALSQTVLGKGSFDAEAQSGLKELFSHYQGRHIEAELMRAKTARTTYYCGNKTSVEGLRSADTFQPNDSKKVKDLMAANQAPPILAGARKNGDEPIYAYYILGNNRLYDDMHQSDTWQNLLALAGDRGDANHLFYGGLPRWAGTILDEYTLQVNTADGPQGTMATPVAYLGGALGALPATGAYLYGGGSAAAAALTDRLYFQLFPNAQFKQFEIEKIAADTSTERYLLIRNLTASAAGGDAGKFGMYAYQVNDGNKITLTKALRSTDSTSGKIDKTTVGNVTWGVAPWTTDYLTDQHAIGSEIIPCNSYGQPYVAGYALADECLYSAYGSIEGRLAMGRRTFELRDHEREKEIGMDMAWGCQATQDANGLENRFAVIYGSYNPAGLPVIA